MKVAILVATTLAAASVAVVGAEILLGTGHLLPASIAVGLCLPAAMITLVLTGEVWGRWPDYGPVAVLVGTAARMGAAVGGVWLVGPAASEAGVTRERLAVWVAVLYLITLVIESALLVRGALARDRRPAGAAGTT